MAKTGRPRKGDEQGTTQVRCFLPMAQQLADLTLVLPLTTAQLLQRVAGANLSELHETHAKQIQAVKEANAAAEAARQRAMQEAAELEQKRARGKRPRAES